PTMGSAGSATGLPQRRRAPAAAAGAIQDRVGGTPPCLKAPTTGQATTCTPLPTLLGEASTTGCRFATTMVTATTATIPTTGGRAPTPLRPPSIRPGQGAEMSMDCRGQPT